MLLMRMMMKAARLLRETTPAVCLTSKVRVAVGVRLRIVGILLVAISGQPTTKLIQVVVWSTKIQRSWPNVPKKES